MYDIVHACMYMHMCVCLCMCITTHYTEKTETMTDQVQSIMAQLKFSYHIHYYHDVPFRHYLYVPETHPVTQFPKL